MYTVINIYPALMCKKNNTKINAKQKVKTRAKCCDTMKTEL